MTQLMIPFDRKQDQKLEKLSKEWKIAKYNVVKKLVDDFDLKTLENKNAVPES